MSGSVAPQSSGQLQEDNLQYQLQEVQISRPVVQVETNDGNRQHRTHVSRPGVVTEEKYPRRRGKEELEAIAIADVKEAIEIDNQRWRLRAKIIFGVLLVGVVTAAIVDLVCHDNVQNWLDLCFDWIEENPEAGVVVFALIFCLATLLFVPGLVLTIGAGIAFGRALGFGYGLLWGSVAVIAGAFAACVIAFYLGRYVLHEQAQRCAQRYRILGAVNTAIETNGVKVMILLRLSPLVPFSGFNFISGLTKVSPRDYMIGCVGVIPGTVSFVFIGASTAGTMNEEESINSEEANKTTCIIRMCTLIIGGCAAVIALVAITIYARRELKKALVESKINEVKAETREADKDLDSGSREEIKEEVESVIDEDTIGPKEPV